MTRRSGCGSRERYSAFVPPRRLYGKAGAVSSVVAQASDAECEMEALLGRVPCNVIA